MTFKLRHRRGVILWPEMEKAADMADMPVLFFSPGASFLGPEHRNQSFNSAIITVLSAQTHPLGLFRPCLPCQPLQPSAPA